MSILRTIKKFAKAGVRNKTTIVTGGALVTVGTTAYAVLPVAAPGVSMLTIIPIIKGVAIAVTVGGVVAIGYGVYQGIKQQMAEDKAVELATK